MGSSSSASSELIGLAKKAAGGDERAFAQLFAQFRPHLRQFIDLRLDRRIRRRVDLSDIIQETQIEVHQRLADFLKRQPMPIRVWMRKTALEHLIRAHEKHLKAGRRSVIREARLSNRSSVMLAQRIAAVDHSPSQQAIAGENVQIVANAISELLEIDREILIMRNVESLDFNEIAFSLDISPEAARKRFGRALMRLQKQLQPFDLGDNLE